MGLSQYPQTPLIGARQKPPSTCRCQTTRRQLRPPRLRDITVTTPKEDGEARGHDRALDALGDSLRATLAAAVLDRGGADALALLGGHLAPADLRGPGRVPV